ncbi:hypothetical protein HNR65_001602 [Desulfosalsimonas propionicica]|uniref:Acyl-CoA dehydrogenase n=1 Tax=Desulfosalsimonas propionicica TaxID=332175 RepID=A0A7W0C8T4_9BACT|nr:acyl-CoA dehydrogenase [Desulfosalsimonas propionicica]MBA2881276.1 hypothetical protein [Desulfosalsimonas propionicica]
MAQILADRRDIDFVLYEQFDAEQLTRYHKFADQNKKLFDMLVTEARNLSVKEILPTNAEGDEQGVVFENGQVRVPECFHRPFRLLLDGEWTSMTESPEYGGQGIPNMINTAVLEYIWGANYCLANYGMMGHGTGKMIELFGTPEQKALFVKKLYKGQWGGTMLLTEPEAGSDVGALTTSARKNTDGTYSITGNKIFITNGDHDLTENIIHPVLARVEGAPAGTRGISIFIVPKIWVNEDGSPGEPNDVVCTGVEKKLGIHASATCSIALGQKGQCRGLLLGEENQGMPIMFHMMNEARLNVGFQGFTYASAAYLYAANYAKQRIQGRDIAAGKDPEAPNVPIVVHPDVRRMLMWMKAHVDGMRSFIYYVSLLMDRKNADPEGSRSETDQDLIDFFIPLAKAYCSQRSFDVCATAMQVYGGYGYTREFPVEQLMRDCRITSIYEGTDGIQAMDLIGRKLRLKNGRLFACFVEDVGKTISRARDIPALKDMADVLARALARLEQAAGKVSRQGPADQVRTAYAYAFPFLEVTGDVIVAWMLLWRACVASEKLAAKVRKKDKTYYQGIMYTAEFFICNLLPPAMGKMDCIVSPNSAAIDIADECFGG